MKQEAAITRKKSQVGRDKDVRNNEEYIKRGYRKFANLMYSYRPLDFCPFHIELAENSAIDKPFRCI